MLDGGTLQSPLILIRDVVWVYVFDWWIQGKYSYIIWELQMKMGYEGLCPT